jgi:pyruvate/2-oxoglutarate dehydrogenase complex dihydrolipoamide dehydrogenase (E3) component
MNRHAYDVIVIGAGSGGYAAARTARELGASVALVDKGPLGGLCILRGCMPSKALLASSDAAFDAREAGALGVHASGISVDMPFIAARKRGLVQSFAEYRIEGIRTFPLYEGDASFVSASELRVSACHPEPREGSDCHPERSERSERSRRTAADVILEAKSFIIATGSVVAPPAFPGLAETGYLDSDAVLELERIPASVVVLGGGYTACELGQFLSRMGARTTMVVRSTLLSHSDDDVSATLVEAFEEEGIEVVAGGRVVRVERRGDEKVVHVEAGGHKREIVAEEIFYALGRVPNTDGMQLGAAGIRQGGAGIVEIDGSLRTTAQNIFAIGDVTGEFLLVHVAIYQGEVAARNAVLGTREQPDYRTFSAHTVFCDPQVARVGKSEKALRAARRRYVVGKYAFAEHGKAMCLGKTKGFVKIVADAQSGEILGATVVGAQGSELIHEVIVAMHYHATVEEFMRIPHLHPTLAEIWTYPAEECAAQLGMKAPGDEQMEVATSGTAT